MGAYVLWDSTPAISKAVICFPNKWHSFDLCLGFNFESLCLGALYEVQLTT